jgi:hypothetical protein
MAGTATNYDVTTISAGSVGILWYDVAVPGAGARMTLHTDGTPDATANPDAVPLGMTRAGSKISVGVQTVDHFADEFAEPIKTTVEQLDGMIECELIQVFDLAALTAITAMAGTVASGSGYEQVRFGRKAPATAPIALIFPTEADPTKFAVFQLYKSVNVAPFAFDKSRKTMSGIACQFKAYAIPTRDATDTLGSFWQQVA